MTGEEAKKRLEKQYKRQNEHIKDNYDRVAILLPKGAKDAIKATGKSLNAYFNELYADDMKRRERAAGTITDPAPDTIPEDSPEFLPFH